VTLKHVPEVTAAKAAKKKSKNVRQFLSYKKRNSALKGKQFTKKQKTAAKLALQAKREESSKLVILSSSEKMEASIEYLRHFHNDRQSWNFKKPYQNWLLNNFLYKEKVSCQYFIRIIS
ncbi:hypothetical protein Ciccas_013195, partial [Cichlidogyrus casuarinus]